jgi:hypothetical protein
MLQIPPQLNNLQSAFYVLVAGALLGWRFEAWLTKHIEPILTRLVGKAVTTAMEPVKSDVARHTVQIAQLHQDIQNHKRQITQIVFAGANTITAALWPSRPPSNREKELLVEDWRRILGADDIDRNIT